MDITRAIVDERLRQRTERKSEAKEEPRELDSAARSTDVDELDKAEFTEQAVVKLQKELSSTKLDESS